MTSSLSFPAGSRSIDERDTRNLSPPEGAQQRALPGASGRTGLEPARVPSGADVQRGRAYPGGQPRRGYGSALDQLRSGESKGSASSRARAVAFTDLAGIPNGTSSPQPHDEDYERQGGQPANSPAEEPQRLV